MVENGCLNGITMSIATLSQSVTILSFTRAIETLERGGLWHGHSFSYEGALRTEHVLTWCVSGSKWSKR
jgi:hypothetical protein